MEKRFLLALGLSFLVLAVYSFLMPKTQTHIGNQCVVETTKRLPVDVTRSTSEITPGLKTDLDFYNSLDNKNLYILKDEDLVLEFSKKGGFILNALDKTRGTVIPFRSIGFVKEWSDYLFDVSPISGGVVFDYHSEQGYGIKKTYRIIENNTIELSIRVYDITDSKITGYEIFAGYCNPSEAKDAFSQRYYESSVVVNDTIQRRSVYGLKKAIGYEGKVLWAGLRDRYFCTIFLPQLFVNKCVVNFSGPGVYSVLNIPERRLETTGSSVEDHYKIFIGPQDLEKLKSFGNKAEQIISFGKFDSISKILLFLLSLSYKLTGSWGWSIIIISILVYMLLSPLSLKSMHSMRKMQALQPKIEELRLKYKDSPQKLNIEIMEIYKREKVNPFGGCLPMFLQIPVFIALYQLLMRFISLKCASFLWIKDLSEPDRLLVFKNNFPIIGRELNILPILMAGIMFLQQSPSRMPGAVSSSMAEQQRMMRVMMPVLFGVLFYKMPSGLVLYWFVNSLLMLVFQWKISKTKI